MCLHSPNTRSWHAKEMGNQPVQAVIKTVKFTVPQRHPENAPVGSAWGVCCATDHKLLVFLTAGS